VSNKLLIIFAPLISLPSFAFESAMSPGVYNERTGNTIQANCLQWDSPSHDVCNQLQFIEITKDKTTMISSRIDGVAASQLGAPATAPVKSIDESKPDAFKITKKAWGFGYDQYGTAMGATTGSLLVAGMAAGAGIAFEIPGRPAVSKSQDLSENLPNENGYIYNVQFVDDQVKATEASGGTTWVTFFNESKNMSPEQRVAFFVQLFNYNSSSDPKLISNFISGTNYTLARIEYVPGYSVSQVINNNEQGGTPIRIWYHQYYFVFVPTAELPQYQQYIANTQAANAKALKWWRQDMYIYFGSVVGTTLLVAAAPTIADIFRDLVVFPGSSAHRRHLRKENERILTKWAQVWENLFNKDVKKPLAVSNEIYTALRTAITTKHPMN